MKQKKYTYSARAILLALIFTAPLLVNPLHFVFIKHKASHSHSHNKATVAEKEQDCSYCDFHFSGFVSNFSLHESQSFVRHTYKAAHHFTYHIISYSINTLYAGRAPPKPNYSGSLKCHINI